jgi:DNA-binding response OmpR family regulator
MIHADDSRIPLVAIIDDEEDVTTYLSLALEDSGYRVVTTNEPALAMTLLRRHRPDLICLDLLMPERMGSSLYLEICGDSDLEAIPVLILSGLNAREELAELLQRQANIAPPAGYIEKPPDAEQFIDTVRSLLREHGGLCEGASP